MLTSRYKYDGKSVMPMNELQLQMKAQIDRKVKDGVYKFESVPCCICQHENFETLAEKDRYGLYFSVKICRVCGLIQTNPRMTQESYNVFYNEEYRPLYNGDAQPSETFFKVQYRRGSQIWKFLQKSDVFDKLPTQPMVVEIGCGAGGILKYFEERGCKVLGYDLGETYVNYGAANHKLDLKVGSLNDLPDDIQPDLIIYAHVLEHILDPVHELYNVRAKIQNGGYAYFEMPGVKNLRFMSYYNFDFLRVLQNAHTYHFSLETTIMLMRMCGLQLHKGSQFIRGVLHAGNAEKLIENDYESVMAYLHWTEGLRPYVVIHPRDAARWLKDKIHNVLR